ncbi:MAG: STELLO glycosyltransferase family protein [Pseudomonadota bacterium]
MNYWIVITTIHKPQAAIEAISTLCQRSDWHCVVVGDKKTPVEWQADNIHYLSVEAQKRQYPKLAELLPYHHYCRKNIGYLYAIQQGADCILETDDDNLPLPQFGQNLHPEVQGDLVNGSDWVNVYRYFTDRLIWPRGNPLDTIHDTGHIVGVSRETCPIQQFLADGDPDVDAIYRLLYQDEVYFDHRPPIILEVGSWCAFNSQNTVFWKEAFPALYLPSHVSFRMTDIWRSFVAQIVLWSEQKKLCFSSATVQQIRNQHDLMHDFSDEVTGYLNNRRICEILLNEMQTWKKAMPMAQKVQLAWRALYQHQFIEKRELDILDCWIDMARIPV